LIDLTAALDMTGVVTEQHFFFKDGFKAACDCAAKCLEEPNKCTNWVWKHTFMPENGGKRSCTLYSSPNLPTDVTLKYDLANSKGFNLLQAANNPQAGAPAPLTFLDAAGKIPDKFGVSGFMVQDQNGGFSTRRVSSYFDIMPLNRTTWNQIQMKGEYS
jgi:hypothetical protein